MSAVGLGRREPCVVCNQPVFLAQRLLVERRLYHRTCFTCARCGTQLSLAGCYQTETDGQFCCETCPDEDSYHDSDDAASLKSAPVSIETMRQIGETNAKVDSLEAERNVYNRTVSDEEKTRSLNRYNDALVAERSAYDESRKELSAQSNTSSKALSGFLNSQFDNDSDDEDVLPALPKSLPPVKPSPVERLPDICEIKQIENFNISPVAVGESGVVVSQPSMCDSGLPVSARAAFVPVNSSNDDNRLVSDLSLNREQIGHSPSENELPNISASVESEKIVSPLDEEVEMKCDISSSAEDDTVKLQDVNMKISYVNQLDTASDLKKDNDLSESDEGKAEIDDAIAKDSQKNKSDAFDDQAMKVRENTSPEPSDRSLVKMRMKVFESANSEAESRLSRVSSQRSNLDLSKDKLSIKDDSTRISYLESATKSNDAPVMDAVVDKSDFKASDESNSQNSDVPCNDEMPYISSTIMPPAQENIIAHDAIVNFKDTANENDKNLEVTLPLIDDKEVIIEVLPNNENKHIETASPTVVDTILIEENVDTDLNEKKSGKLQEDNTFHKKHDATVNTELISTLDASISSPIIEDDNSERKLDDAVDIKSPNKNEVKETQPNENEVKETQNESKESTMMDVPVDQSKDSKRDLYPEDLNPFGDSDDEEELVQTNIHPQAPQRRPITPNRRSSLMRGIESDITVESTPPKKVSTNPFGSSSEDEEEVEKQIVPVKKKSGEKPPRPPPPSILINAVKSKADTSDSKRLIPAPSINLNPFWSEGDEDNSDDEAKKQMPVPTPRQRLNDGQNPSPMPRYTMGVGPPPSFHSSSSSLTSTISRRKKAPAPKPPMASLPVAAPRKNSDTLSTEDLQDTSLLSRLSTPNSSMSHISPQASPRSRKRRPAPLPPAACSTLIDSPSLSMDSSLNLSGPRSLQLPPVSHPSPIVRDEISRSSAGLSGSRRVIPVDDSNVECLDDTFSSEWDGDKSSRDEISKNRLSTESDGLSPPYPNKSTSGQWKRRKGPAPAVPLLERRAAGPPLAPAALRRELLLLEAQQRGLEKQGVRLEEIIREKCEGADLPEGTIPEPDPETDELVMQLFELVNEKNELFRRQAELMYIRRQQRLEEEYADLEHQIRCLMARPELNKTDSDKAREEQLIQRLVEVVERRNEVVTSLEMDRLREREEDKSISERMASHRAKLDETYQPIETPKKKEKKKDKKKWMKRDKAKKTEVKDEQNSDVNDADSLKKEKKLKKWFHKS